MRCLWCCSWTPEPGDCVGGDVSGQLDPDQRVPTRSRQAHPGTQCGGGDPGAQPSVRKSCEPSRADEVLTQTLRASLALVDARVLDHFIVAGNGNAILSLAESGLL
jgi:hypothetical protein